jgi:hypothetical protein
MRQAIFSRRRLRASYRNVPMDDIVALIRGVDYEDDLLFESFANARSPRRMKKEE